VLAIESESTSDKAIMITISKTGLLCWISLIGSFKAGTRYGILQGILFLVCTLPGHGEPLATDRPAPVRHGDGKTAERTVERFVTPTILPW
jgi:hypothetical protein